VAPVRLTASTSSPDTARTWDTLPGMPSAWLEARVCTESTM